ncbi:MAG: PA2169 family four-helix-bundle protein [Verrucomicrobiota bacterium]
MKQSPLTEAARDEIAGHLNDLVAICIDGEKGYHAAAEDTENPELKLLFTRLSRQRADFAVDLKRAVGALGCEPRDSSHLAGALHRGWLTLKATVVKNDTHAVLAECERGEDKAVAAYRTVLAEATLDSGLRNLVSAQASDVQAAHDQIRDLRDHPAYATDNS